MSGKITDSEFAAAGFGASPEAEAARARMKRINPDAINVAIAEAQKARECPMTRGAATRLANELGVSLTVICGIRAGKRWASPPSSA